MSTVHIDSLLVQQLIAKQFPQWKDLVVKPVDHSGWDNRTFHLGETMLVRLPSAERYILQVEKEQYWLPKLAPQLQLPIPKPLAMGKPSDIYPWHWSIYAWINGETASHNNISDLNQFAAALAHFLRSLQHIDSTGGPVAGPHNFYRGGALTKYNKETMWAIEMLGDIIDTKAVTHVWHEALTSTWENDPIWIHGDIAPGNLLVKNGCLSAVIDFGCLAIGDPACDLAITWTFFSGESRETFLTTLQLDNATIARARGWALWKILITCAELPGISDIELENSKRIINEILVDHTTNILKASAIF